MRATFNVNFFIQKTKCRTDGQAPILARLTVNQSRIHFSTKCFASPDCWDNETHRTDGSTKELKATNRLLDDLQASIHRHFYDMQSAGEVITAAKIKMKLFSTDEKANMSLGRLFDIFLTDYEKLVLTQDYGHESFFRYKICKDRVMAFIQKEFKTPDLPLDSVNKRLLDRLYLYLRTDRKLNNNTAVKFLHRFSSVFKMARDNGWVNGDPFKLQHLHLDKVDRSYLNQQELNTIINKEFESKRLEQVRDVFVFCCFTGLPYIDGEIFKVFSCIETFIFRRLMCGLPTNALNKIFATLHNSVIKFKTPEISYSDIMIFSLESRKASGAFPKDSEFITGFTTRNVYSMKGKNKEYIFDRLENGSSKEKNDISANMANGNLTIEHIMPQTINVKWEQALGPNWREIHEKWQHCIANLTLTGYNSKYSNLPFRDKKTIENGFCQSGLRLNQYIAKFDKWTEDELNTRNAKLSEMALKIWPYPATSFVPPVNEGDTSSLADDTNAQTGRQIQYYEFFGDKIAVQSWAELLWKVVNTLFELDPTILYDVAKSDNVWFMTETDDPDYHKLADGLYFCNSKSNTYNKIAILKNLFKLYGIDEDDLTFLLKPIEDSDDSSAAS